jgi:hypothetical protein
MENVLEHSGRGLIHVVSLHLSGGTEEDHEKRQTAQLMSEPRYEPRNAEY